MVKIAVIDDGVNPEMLSMSTKCIFYTIENQEIVQADPLDYNSHGSICAHIIEGYAKDFEIISIKILDRYTKKSSIESMLIALKWCFNRGIKLINLSIGSSYFYDVKPFQKIVEKMGKEIVIVAAGNNENTITYPASLPGVIGVRCDRYDYLNDGNYFVYREPLDGINIVGYVKREIITLNSTQFEVCPCNSFAAPFVTALVCNIMNQNIKTFEDIMQIMQSGAIEQPLFHSLVYYKKILHWKDEIDIPIVASVYENKIEEPKKLLRGINKLFFEDGYHSIMIDCFGKSDISENEFTTKINREWKIELSDLIKLYINITNSDLVFLLINNEEFRQLREEKIIDVVINHNSLQYDNMISINVDKEKYSRDDMIEIFNKLRNILE